MSLTTNKFYISHDVWITKMSIGHIWFGQSQKWVWVSGLELEVGKSLIQRYCAFLACLCRASLLTTTLQWHFLHSIPHPCLPFLICASSFYNTDFSTCKLDLFFQTLSYFFSYHPRYHLRSIYSRRLPKPHRGNNSIPHGEKQWNG